MSAPPIPYFGGKTTLASKIVRLFPPHAHYVEPYGGSLAVLLAKPPSRMETVNDLDNELMTFWKVLRDNPVDLARVCALTPHSRAEHRASYRRDGCDDLELARRVWVQLTQGRSGQLRRTGWRHYVNPSGSSIGMPAYLSGYVGRIAAAAERLSQVSLECRPAIELIQAFASESEALLYVDPPYLGSTRTSGSYRHDMPDDDQHRELAEVLHSCRGAVVLSGYPSALYDDLYQDWYRVSMLSGTGQGNVWANRTEVLWSNRPLGDQPGLWDEP